MPPKHTFLIVETACVLVEVKLFLPSAVHEDVSESLVESLKVRIGVGSPCFLPRGFCKDLYSKEHVAVRLYGDFCRDCPGMQVNYDADSFRN